MFLGVSKITQTCSLSSQTSFPRPCSDWFGPAWHWPVNSYFNIQRRLELASVSSVPRDWLLGGDAHQQCPGSRVKENWTLCSYINVLQFWKAGKSNTSDRNVASKVPFNWFAVKHWYKSMKWKKDKYLISHCRYFPRVYLLTSLLSHCQTGLTSPWPDAALTYIPPTEVTASQLLE